MEEPIKLSVIVICHNDAAVIERCDTDLMSVLGTLSFPIEVLYVDNGSIDDTVFRLSKSDSQAELSHVERRILSLRRQFALNTAFSAGVHHSTGEFILTIDPHLTVDPLEIPRMVSEIDNGYDVVVGWRQRQHLSSFVQGRSRLLNRITASVTGVHLHDYGSTFRIMRREVLQDINMYGSNLFAFIPVFAFMSGAILGEIPVVYRPDYYVGREYTPTSVVTSSLDLITIWFLSRHAEHPMHIFGGLGLLFIVISVLVIIGAIINRAVFEVSLIQTPLPTLAGILLAVGIQTILLGLTTELVLRGFYETRDKPNYSVRKITDLP